MKQVILAAGLLLLFYSCEKGDSSSTTFQPLAEFDDALHHALLQGQFPVNQACCSQYLILSYQKSFDQPESHFVKTVYGGHGSASIDRLQIGNTVIPLAGGGDSHLFSYPFSGQSTVFQVNGVPTDVLLFEEYDDVPFEINVDGSDYVGHFPSNEHISGIRLSGIFDDELRLSDGMTISWDLAQAAAGDVKVQVSDLHGTDVEIFTENDGEYFVSGGELEVFELGERLIVSLFSANYMLNQAGIFVGSLDIQNYNADLFLRN